jgi:hypothetical protein
MSRGSVFIISYNSQLGRRRLWHRLAQGSKAVGVAGLESTNWILCECQGDFGDGQFYLSHIGRCTLVVWSDWPPTKCYRLYRWWVGTTWACDVLPAGNRHDFWLPVRRPCRWSIRYRPKSSDRTATRAYPTYALNEWIIGCGIAKVRTVFRPTIHPGGPKVMSPLRQ